MTLAWLNHPLYTTDLSLFAESTNGFEMDKCLFFVFVTQSDRHMLPLLPLPQQP